VRQVETVETIDGPKNPEGISVTITTKQADKLRLDVKDARVSAHQAELKLAELLYKAQTEHVSVGGNLVPLYEHWLYTSWEEYLQLELGMSDIEELQNREVWKFWGLTCKQGQGWTHAPIGTEKMYLLLDVVVPNPKSADVWLDRASKLTVLEVANLVAKQQVKTKSFRACVKLCGPIARVVSLRQLLGQLRGKLQAANNFEVAYRVCHFAITEHNKGRNIP
jgi:hypothetical protein